MVLMNLVFSIVMAKQQINTSSVKTQLKMTKNYVIIILLNSAIKIIVLRHVVLQAL
jgi:hypothetical protein